MLVSYLKGVGPKKAEILKAECNITTIEELLHFFPRKYVDYSQATRIADIKREGATVSLVGKITQFELYSPNGAKRQRLSALLKDATGVIELTWFQNCHWVLEKFKDGDEVVILGKTQLFNNRYQITHPEIEKVSDEDSELSQLKIIPFYASSAKLKKWNLDSRGFRKIIREALKNYLSLIEENLTPAICQKYQLIPKKEAIGAIHFPSSFVQLQAAQKRLKFEELFFFECLMAKRKWVVQSQHQSRPFAKIGHYFNTFYYHHLPFELTNAQKRVIREIRHDVAKTTQMNRLVQGDVGSGKTIVAVMAMLMAVDNGFQAALLAPTEILAEQHWKNVHRLLSPLGLQVDMLTGGMRKSLKKRVLEDTEQGKTHILIGTHALLEDTVRFHNLGLTIIDEQHKFGVLQRSKLWKKNDFFPHNLSMTATPIPRSLALTLYGDLDVSRMDELPPGRKPVKTIVKTEAHRLEINGMIQRELEKGHQVYVVYPLVEESEKLDLIAVEQGYALMQRQFPNYRVGIVHGKMKPEAKEFEMHRFATGQTHILVATTVIEVGVDVPNATLMVIEHAERFGLSQLHQLRGRVGRGGEQAYAILVASEKVGYEGKQRLLAMASTNDGFKIAEYDLKLRGPGDFLGTRQSGLPEFKLTNLATDGSILLLAQQAAFELIKNDPQLALPEHQMLKKFLMNYVNQHHLEDLLA
ncbi:MAG: ATP-dependent DNA helicase RecG [Bacteroidia bacterium]|nr:ATP-dependent DNA helicase RecG [Bacteroidia bacterium]MDW8157353.1 ATP-dependent DNA helicase RecG [Bacteroidia bacterium]